MLARWDPFDEMEWLTSRFFGDRAGRMGRALTPAVDIFENDDELELRVELPGMKPEDVQVDVSEGVLTVSGERRLEHDEERDGYRRIERSHGRFSRSFVLPRYVDPQNVQADMRDGVLRLSLPKREEQRRRRIPIGAGPREGGRRIEVEKLEKGERARATEGAQGGAERPREERAER